MLGKLWLIYYVAVVSDAVLPEVPHGELLPDDHGGPEDHHQSDADNPPSGVVEGQGVIEHWNMNEGIAELLLNIPQREQSGHVD